MNSKILVFVVNIFQVYSFQQNDYRLIHERISLDFYNTSWARDAKFVLFHYKRYEKRFNFSVHLLQDLGTEITNTAQAYKFQSNEYRQFPVLYTANACRQTEQDQFGLGTAHFDTNIKKCPIKKGFYYGVNIYIDDSKLPPFAPRGRYMLELTVYYKKTILLASGKWYGAIEPTNPLEHVIL